MNQSAPGTRDGFQLLKDRFEVPKDLSSLDPQTTKALAICDLFLNRKLSLGNVVRLLNEDIGRVVLALLEQGIIRDRRKIPRQAAERERRKSVVAEWERNRR
jgi:hypothetical protein